MTVGELVVLFRQRYGDLSQPENLTDVIAIERDIDEIIPASETPLHVPHRVGDETYTCFVLCQSEWPGEEGDDL